MEEMTTNQPVTEEPKKSGKKAGIIVAVIAVIAIIAAAAYFMAPKKDAKTVVVDAIASAVDTEETSPLEEIFGWEEFYEAMKTSPYQVDLEVQLDGGSEDLADLTSGKLFMTSKADPESRSSSAVFGIGYAGMDLAKLQAYMDDTNLIMAIPELSSKAFTLNYKDDLAGRIKNSELISSALESSGMDPEETANYITEYFQYLQDNSYGADMPFDLKALWSRYREGSQAIDNLKAAMTVEEIEGKTQTINGKEESVDGYQVQVSKEAFAEFLTATKEFIMADEAFKSDVVEYFDIMANSYKLGGMTMNGEAIPGGEAIWAQLGEAMEQGIDSIGQYVGDIDASVYVTKDGRLASYEATTVIAVPETAAAEDGAAEAEADAGTEAAAEEAGSTAVTLTVKGQYEGGYHMGANSSTEIGISDGVDTVSVVIDRAGTYDKEVYDDSVTVTVLGGESEFSAILRGSYTVADSTYTLNMDLGVDGKTIAALDLAGAVQNLVKGESFDATIDQMKFQIMDEDGMTELSMDMSGRYAVIPLEGGVDMPEGETMDVLAATEEDWNNVAMELFANAVGILTQLQ